MPPDHICKTRHSTIEGPDGHHLLPTAHAIWIPAETRHRTMIRDLDGVSVYFDPAYFPQDHMDHIQTFPITRMLQEMLLHTVRWQPGSVEHDPIARSFFQTVGLLCVEKMQAKAARLFTLPRPTHPSIVRALEAALVSPGQANLNLMLRHAGMSERSFRRHFHRETRMTWQDWIAQACLFHAANLLAEGQRVTDVAAGVGYASLGAFAKAFTNLMGMLPVWFRNL